MTVMLYFKLLPYLPSSSLPTYVRISSPLSLLHTHTHIHTHIHTNTHSHKHTLTHSHAHKHTLTHTHTHTHTHTCPLYRYTFFMRLRRITPNIGNGTFVYFRASNTVMSMGISCIIGRRWCPSVRVRP